MAGRLNTVLIIGATSGIGEAFARRFHSLGKKVIITGRNKEKLTTLAQELPGVEGREFHIDDLASIGTNLNDILKEFPSIDSVILTAGIQKCYNLFDPSSTSPDDIISEISTNLTAPSLLVHYLAPHLLKLAQTGTKTTLFLTSSSLAYVPLSFYPTYVASKAGVAALTKALRQQLSFIPGANENLAIVEIVPPYTDTPLDKVHREATVAMQGGADKAFPPMPLDEYVDKFFEALELAVGKDGSVKPEIGVGFGALGVETWRGSFGKIFEGMGLSV
ncbi:hypothetical protein BD289DRAFT_461484 [Coniella lustricola]|uniref:NAD(P)-binding protein n=1 Tax=Coniella lustricola TaxID=2025994 RepID=A0A2T3A569_9PEZI|nr:hypothetical protein BD289DRAFT_461484 [Coniella lustricola]